MDYQIRRMKEGDIEQVAAIERAIFSLPWSEKSFRDAISNQYNMYLVCIVENFIAGYIGLWSVLGEGNITNVAVADNFRKRGIGSALLAEAEKRAATELDVSIFFLEVRMSNENAQRLYEKAGYEKIGIRKNFYERPVEDALIMSKIDKQSKAI